MELQELVRRRDSLKTLLSCARDIDKSLEVDLNAVARIEGLIALEKRGEHDEVDRLLDEFVIELDQVLQKCGQR